MSRAIYNACHYTQCTLSAGILRLSFFQLSITVAVQEGVYRMLWMQLVNQDLKLSCASVKQNGAIINNVYYVSFHFHD